jgi:hypothetical protein
MYNKDLVGKEVVGTDARKVGAVTRVPSAPDEGETDIDLTASVVITPDAPETPEVPIVAATFVDSPAALLGVNDVTATPEALVTLDETTWL